MENKIDIGYLRALLYAGCPEISIEEQSALSNAIKAMESMDKLIQERDSVWKTAREQYQFDLGMETRELKAKIAELESRKLSIDKVALELENIFGLIEGVTIELGEKIGQQTRELYFKDIAKAIVESTDLWEG